MQTAKPKAKRFVRLEVLMSEDQIERAKAIAASLPHRDILDVGWREFLSAVAKCAIDHELNREEAPVLLFSTPTTETKP